jgi:hypothetical protein
MIQFPPLPDNYPQLTPRRVSPTRVDVYEGDVHVATLTHTDGTGLHAGWRLRPVSREADLVSVAEPHPFTGPTAAEVLRAFTHRLYSYRQNQQRPCVPQCVYRSGGRPYRCGAPSAVRLEGAVRVATPLSTTVATLGGVTTYRVPGCAHGERNE